MVFALIVSLWDGRPGGDCFAAKSRQVLAGDMSPAAFTSCHNSPTLHQTKKTNKSQGGHENK
jgi:hypothetical protein